MNEIQSLLKRMLHSGIDAVTSVNETETSLSEQSLSEQDVLSKQGVKTTENQEWVVGTELPQEEGEQIVNNFIKEIESKKVSLEEKLNFHISSLLSKMDLLSRNEFLELEERMKKMEQKVAPKFEITFGEEE